MSGEVKFIQRSIRRNLEDLHICFMDSKTTIDITLYNAVNLALLEAEADVQAAVDAHKKAFNKHG